MTTPKPTITARILSMVALVVMLIGPASSSVASPPGQAGAGLFTDAATTGVLEIPDDPTIVRTRFVNVNFDLLGVADSSPEGQPEVANVLVLNLFEDVVFTAVLKSVEFNPSGGFSWIGHLEGVEYGQVILAVRDRVMAGNITMPGAFYQVRYIGDGVHTIYQINQAAFPLHADPIPVDISQETSASSAPTLLADDGSIIDVMVVYTGAARSAARGTPAMNAVIDLAVVETNQSYENSLITQRLRLVHTEEVTYSESGFDWYDTIDRLRGTSDGYMDNVHPLRNTYGADAVVLIVNDTGFCGLAYMMDVVDHWFEAWAFGLVSLPCATGYYSFAHELGHNMGARHDWYVDSLTTPYPYNHGYVNVPDQWRTMMAYNSECQASGVNCTKLQYWSNPDVTYGGDPMGVPEGTSTACTEGNLNNPPCDADNRKTLNNTAYTVANFRVSSSGDVGPVVYDGHMIDDDVSGQSSGNDDGIANCGESIELYVDLRNQGSDTATDVNASISKTDPYVTWLHNTTSDYPDLPDGGTGTNTDDFDFAVDPATPDGHVIQFDLDITASNGGPWSDSLDVPVVCTSGLDWQVFVPLVTKNFSSE